MNIIGSIDERAGCLVKTQEVDYFGMEIDKVLHIRQQLDIGTYPLEDYLDVVVDRLLEDLL